MSSVSRTFNGQGRRIILRLLPLLLFFLLLFAAGLCHAFIQSLGMGLPLESSYKGVEAYRVLLADETFRESFLFSFRVALISASVSVILAVPLAVMIWRLPPGPRKLSTIYKVPIILPHIAVAFLVLIFFSSSGVASSLLMKWGLIRGQDAFPSLLYSSSGAGMILAYLYKETPFVVLMCMGVLSRIPEQMLQSARMLGAGRWRILFKVILPHLRTILPTTFIILFLYSFGAFDIPYLLGGSRPAMLSIYIYNLYFQGDLKDRPLAMAALCLMALFALIFVGLYAHWAVRLNQKERQA